uniref:ZM domain-containing protein n=1 Tax=Parastrongyloides trichosuri TaxID=131310 RepID=A0A0N4Z1Q9_PARTI
MPHHKRRVRSQSRGRWSVNMKVSVTTEGPNNGLIIQQGIIPQSSMQSDFNTLPTYSFSPTPAPIELPPSSSFENLKTSTPSPRVRSRMDEPLHIQTNPSFIQEQPAQIHNNKSTTLTTVEIFRAPIDEDVQFYKLPPEPISITGQPQYVRAHGPNYETWNQIRTETLIDDPAPEHIINISSNKSVQWKSDLEERLTVSSYSSYTDDTYKDDLDFNEPPKVYGLKKQNSGTLINHETSPLPYRVSSPSNASNYTENRSQSPMVAHILRQQKVITTESTPINDETSSSNGRMSRFDGYREGDLRIKPLVIETVNSPSYNDRKREGRSPSILKNGPSSKNRCRSPSWEEHRKSDLYKTKDVLGNVIDLV